MEHCYQQSSHVDTNCQLRMPTSRRRCRGNKNQGDKAYHLKIYLMYPQGINVLLDRVQELLQLGNNIPQGTQH
jgi:hypothetical protein